MEYTEQDLNKKSRTFVINPPAWKRILAFFIDFLILDFIVLVSFKGMFKKYMPQDYNFSEMYALLQSNSKTVKSLVTLGLFASLLCGLYFIFLERKMQQSVGKRFMKLYVVDNQNIGNAPTLWQHIVRNLYSLPIFPLILLWILDPLFMLFRKDTQRLSEILSKTKVIEITKIPL